MLLASVVALMKKGTDLPELGIASLVGGVALSVCVRSQHVLLPAFRECFCQGNLCMRIKFPSLILW